MKGKRKIITGLAVGLVLTFLPLAAGFQDKAGTDRADAELFNRAKKAVFEQKWPDAARLFSDFCGRYPRDSRTAEAWYWHGYSLNKTSTDKTAPETVREIRKQAFAILEKMGKKFPGDQWAQKAEVLMVEIAETLVSLGAPEYRKFISGSAQKGDDIELKLVAIDSLLQMDKEKAFPILEKVLRTHADPRMRERALFVLSQSGDKRVVPLLLDIAVNDRDASVREKAIFWLGQQEGKAAFNGLRQLWEKTTDRALREKILFSIAQIDGEEAFGFLVEVARNAPDESLKEKAVFWIGQSSEKSAPAVLIDLYQGSKSMVLKERIIFAISQLDGNTAARSLIRLYRKEGDQELKKKIIFWLGQTDGDEARKFLEEILNG